MSHFRYNCAEKCALWFIARLDLWLWITASCSMLPAITQLPSNRWLFDAVSNHSAIHHSQHVLSQTECINVVIFPRHFSPSFFFFFWSESVEIHRPFWCDNWTVFSFIDNFEVALVAHIFFRNSRIHLVVRSIDWWLTPIDFIIDDFIIDDFRRKTAVATSAGWLGIRKL